MNELAIQRGTDEGMRELALFAGAGGGILGGKLLGWRTVCAVERDAYAAQILAQRQNDGILRPFPIWSDVCSFDGKPWRGIVDVVSGGFPCQDISSAGKGAGLDGKRSGLWSEFARIIGEVRPRYAFIENSPMLTIRGLDRVLCDLAAMGFDARWGVISAADCGAPHERERLWIVADSDSTERKTRRSHGVGEKEPAQAFTRFGGSQEMAYTNSAQRKGDERSERVGKKYAYPGSTSGWGAEPDVGRVANGVAHRVDRLKAIGNGQVPICMAEAFRLLSK